MEDFALDPYEQQLLKVFNSHDRDNSGTLDSEGLTQLCQTLQLEEHGVSLVKCLLKSKQCRVNFTDFKDALLALLGNMQNNKTIINEENGEEKSSPEREVSPKFVYGSKKYGRRSRPRNDDINNINEEDSFDKLQTNVSVQRSNSNAEVSSKKRKTNYRLQRCTSLPSNNDLHIANPDAKFPNDPELLCTEEMLREAWKKLGVGQDGYLNQTELILVCNAIGLHKLAEGVIRQLSDKLTLNHDHKISFQELLTILHQDDTWFEVLNQPLSPTEETVLSANEGLFPDSRTFHLVTLGPDGNGTINTDTLIEMWESVGIHSPKELLHELGFNCRRINILDLADVLDKQIKGINEVTRSKYQSPQVALLQASLTLYQSEIKTFKNLLEQMHAEREKLKCHVTEANNRATLLAQEVDDNHSRMEQNTLNQVKLLEQRHADIIKELTVQFSKDKDQLTNVNHALEEKICSLEQEVGKLKNDLSVARKYSLNVEKENQNLSVKIGELERDKGYLTGQIDTLESEKQKTSEIEQQENELLLNKLTSLQIENAQLKDKNDEMVSEIESLSNQVASMRTKVSSTPAKINSLDQSMDENISIICEGVGVGAKRRNQYSPSKENHLFGIEKSPRLGKIRKYAARLDNTDVPFTSSESGFDTEGDYLDSSSSVSTNDNDELTRLQSKVAFLEQILKQNGVPLPHSYEKSNANQCTNTRYLTSRIRDLERLISKVKEAMRALIESDDLNRDVLRKFGEKLDRTLLTDTLETDSTCTASQTDPFEEFEEKVNKLATENRELGTKCADLENCVELLKNEYEKCEDYWQNLVDEERQMYEAEQKVNSDKLAELILKMQDYEEQYAEKDARLPMIEERYNLEKQFTDLEEEFETYKEQSETILSQKDEEIRLLKEKLTELALKQQNDVAVQAQTDSESERIYKKMQNLSFYLVENTNRYPEDMRSQQQNVWNPDWQESAKSLPVNFELYSSNGAPSTSCSTTSLDQPSSPGTPCRPKRTKKYNKNIYKKNEQSPTESKSSEAIEQKILIPLKSFHSLSARRNFLEQRVRQLQFCLQQQKMCNEQTLQRFWHQFNGERVDLHAKLRYLQEKLDQQVQISREQLDKLEKTDMLVKDLYVENSYLLASVQRLEQRCHILTQCSNSSSV